MSKISLKRRQNGHQNLRDDAYRSLTIAQFYLLRRHGSTYRLSSPSAAELISAGIRLKRGWQGVRLEKLYSGADRGGVCPIHSEVVIFETESCEVAEWNRATDEELKAAWYAAQCGCRPLRGYDELPLSCFVENHLSWWAQ